MKFTRQVSVENLLGFMRNNLKEKKKEHVELCDFMNGDFFLSLSKETKNSFYEYRNTILKAVEELIVMTIQIEVLSEREFQTYWKREANEKEER